MSRVTSTVRSWGAIPGDGCAIRAAGGCCELCGDERDDGPTAHPSAARPATARAGSVAPVLRVTVEDVFGNELDCY